MTGPDAERELVRPTPIRETGRVQVRCRWCNWHIVNIRVQGSADIDKTCPNCGRDNVWTVKEPKAA